MGRGVKGAPSPLSAASVSFFVSKRREVEEGRQGKMKTVPTFSPASTDPRVMKNTKSAAANFCDFILQCGPMPRRLSGPATKPTFTRGASED